MRWKFSRGLTSRCSVEFSLAYSLGIIAGFHPSSININFPFLRSVYDRGEEAQVHRFAARTARNANSPLSRCKREIATWNDFVFSLRSCTNALRDPRWRNVSKAWRGFVRAKVSDQFFVTRAIILREVRGRFRAALSFRSLRAADPSVPLLPPRRANRFSRVSICGSMGIF